ncbi:MAG TPA: hypothetical protein VI488_11860 [Candidatus Angelobacter sp.]
MILAWLVVAAPAVRAQPETQDRYENTPNQNVIVFPMAVDKRAEKGISGPTERAGHRFAIGLKASTLGLGIDGGVRLTRRFNLRAGFNAFNYGRDLSSDGIAYNATFRLRSLQALVDWFPFARSFHLSTGLLVYNGNRVSANASVPASQTLTAAGEDFISDPSNPITGRAESGLRKVAPIIGLGFGNLVPRTGHFSFSADFGIVFQGAPHATLTLMGSACDVSGMFCGAVAGDPQIQSDIIARRQTINDDLFFMRFYPFVSLEFGYRF